MKFALALSFLASSASAALTRGSRPESDRRLRINGKGKGGKGKSKTSFEPGNFDWGRLIKDKYGRRYLVANGLAGRVLAYTGEPVEFADGSSSAVNYHTRADGYVSKRTIRL